jgi:predicted RNase H-like nuclease (RuvC/YqgF family)
LSDYTVERSVLSAGTPDEWSFLVRALDGEIKARDERITGLRAGFAALEDALTDSQEVADSLSKEYEGLEARFKFEHELAESLQAEVTQGDQRVDDLVKKYQGVARRVRDLEAAIRDIDAHATPLGGEEFVDGGYLISIGCLHRALALLGQIPTVHHTAHIPNE